MDRSADDEPPPLPDGHDDSVAKKKRVGRTSSSTGGDVLRILSLDGGGFLGLASAAFVAECEQHFETTAHQQFDLFCGTSTGAIIALALANGMRGDQIVDLYRRLGPAVFPNGKLGRVGRFGRSFFTTRYDNVVLRQHMEQAFGDATLDTVMATGKNVMIAAFSLTSGAPRVFKTDHSAELTLHGRYRLADIAMASAAAPTYFPLVELVHPDNGSVEVFCDGGVAANNPAMLGFAEALQAFGRKPSEISVLSISTPRESLAELRKRPWVGDALYRGIVGWALGLPKLFTSAPATLTDGALDRIAKATGVNYKRVSLNNPQCLALDDASEGARMALEQIGRGLASQSGTRQDMSPFFSLSHG